MRDFGEIIIPVTMNSISVTLVKVTVRDSSQIDNGFNKFIERDCNMRHSWHGVFAKAGINLKPLEYYVESAGKKYLSTDLNCKVGDFVKNFKKRPNGSIYKIIVKAKVPFVVPITRRPSEVAGRSNGNVGRASRQADRQESVDDDAETVLIRGSTNNASLLRRRVVLDDDGASQFADTENAEPSGSSEAPGISNALICERLKEYLAYQDAALLIRKELNGSYNTERWNRLTHRFPRTCHLLQGLFKGPDVP